MTRIALVDKDTKKVVNVAVAPQGTNVWFAPEEYLAVKSDVAEIGHLYDEASETFSPDPELEKLKEQGIAFANEADKRKANLLERKEKLEIAIESFKEKESLTVEEEATLVGFENTLENTLLKLKEFG